MKLFSFKFALASVLLPLFTWALQAAPELYDLDTGLRSRSISEENRTGGVGMGGMEASEIGPGRKGAPKFELKSGETYTLCDIEGSGTIRHIWMTARWENKRKSYSVIPRSFVIRAYWDGQEHPSIECPLADFMGLANGAITPYESVFHSIGKHAAFNFWIPMPFASRARITLTNETDFDCTTYYQIDYTLGDKHPEDVGRLHTLFRRENPTTIKEDFVLLPKRTGKGRFLGAVIGVRTLHPGWWGEGEVKVFMDGDEEFPTICGTGAEDYAGLSYGMQPTPYRFHGCNLNFFNDETVEALDLRKDPPEMVEMRRGFISMYRWHVPDPIYWEQECRVTIQQIGCCLYERDDDWSTATFWYEPVPSAPLPPFPSVDERNADLQELWQARAEK